MMPVSGVGNNWGQFMAEGEGASRTGGSGTGKRQGEANVAFAIYILYLLNLFLGLVGIIGVVMAYVFHGDGPDWLQSHYRFQIRTFWIALLYGIICFLLLFVVIGYPLAVLALVWYVFRCVNGMRYLSRGEPYPNPTSWAFG